MKKLLTLAAVLATSLSIQAQGTVNFANRVAGGVLSAPIFDVGGTVGLAGTAFFAQIYAGPAGTADAALTAQGSPVTFSSNAALAGFVNASTVTITGVAPGGTARVIVKAWESSFATFAAAVAGNGKNGSSTSFDVGPLGGTPASGPPLTNPNLIGLTQFSLTQVPEPGTLALGVLGAAALFLRRRK